MSPELLTLVYDIILEFKKSGSITTSQLFDKLEKVQTSPMELEEIYKIFDDKGDEITIANKVQQILSISTPYNLKKGDILRKKII